MHVTSRWLPKIGQALHSDLHMKFPAATPCDDCNRVRNGSNVPSSSSLQAGLYGLIEVAGARLLAHNLRQSRHLGLGLRYTSAVESYLRKPRAPPLMFTFMEPNGNGSADPQWKMTYLAALITV